MNYTKEGFQVYIKKINKNEVKNIESELEKKVSSDFICESKERVVGRIMEFFSDYEDDYCNLFITLSDDYFGPSLFRDYFAIKNITKGKTVVGYNIKKETKEIKCSSENEFVIEAQKILDYNQKNFAFT